MRLIFAIWLALSTVAAPPLFRAQNQATTDTFSPADLPDLSLWLDADDEAQETPTHYWLSHPFTPEQRAAVAQLAAAFPSAIVADYTDPAFPAHKLIDLGLKVKTSSMV